VKSSGHGIRPKQTENGSSKKTASGRIASIPGLAVKENLPKIKEKGSYFHTNDHHQSPISKQTTNRFKRLSPIIYYNLKTPTRPPLSFSHGGKNHD
jgi:hypothetical protein